MRGERVGSVPYGYALAEDGVHLRPVEAELAGNLACGLEVRPKRVLFLLLCILMFLDCDIWDRCSMREF